MLVVGAGGHGRAIAEAADLSGVFEIVGFLDDPPLSDLTVIVYPVLGQVSSVPSHRDACDQTIVAIGNNNLHEIRGDLVFRLVAIWLLYRLDFPRTAFKVKVAETFDVLEAYVSHKIRRLVNSSSASVDAYAVEVSMDESRPFNNLNFYGTTKTSGEAMCRAFCERSKLSLLAFNI